MSIPAVILLVIVVLNLSVKAHLHGKRISQRVSFGYAIIDTVILLTLLYWGGFFD